MRLICQNGQNSLVSAAGCNVIVIDFAQSSLIRRYGLENSTDSTVIAVACSNDGKWIFASYSNKWICCWDAVTQKVIGCRLCNKRPTGLLFSTLFESSTSIMREVLIISDKAGEFWATDIPYMKSDVRVAGHTASIVTDMERSPCGRFIASCDRDEKIRISQFPQMANISKYCPAHKNVVTSIAFNSFHGRTVLFSCGWDCMLCLWDFSTATLCRSISCTPSPSPSSFLTSTVLVPPNSGEGVHIQSEPESLPHDDSHDIDDDANEADGEEDEAGGEEEAIGGDEKNYDVEGAGCFPMRVACPRILGSSDSVGDGIAVVIFRGSSSVHVYGIVETTDSTNITATDTATAVSSDVLTRTDNGSPSHTQPAPSSLKLQLLVDFQLPALPCDVVILRLVSTSVSAGDATETAQNAEFLMVFLLPAPLHILSRRLHVTSTGDKTVALVTTGEGELGKGNRMEEAEAEAVVAARVCFQENDCDFSQRVVFSSLATDEDIGMQKHTLNRAFDAAKLADASRMKKRSKRPDRYKRREEARRAKAAKNDL